MSESEKQLTEKESLALITQMINKAKDSYHDTGTTSMMWGAIIAVCSLVKLSEIHFDYRLPFDIYLLTFLAVIPQIFIILREKRGRKVKSYNDAFMDYLWLGFGICIFLMIFIINSIFHALQPFAAEYKSLAGQSSSFRLNEFVAPLFLLLYGMPTFVTGATCKFKPMLWGGILCWGCCIITIFTTIKIDLLLTALSAIAAWFIPGLIMEREYRLYKKDQTLLNV
jgi:hypothetical protein